jgi:hypothetical protein
MILALLLCLVLPAVFASEPAYRADRRPLTCFMSIFRDLPMSDLQVEKLVDDQFGQAGLTIGDFSPAAQAGKTFYEAAKDRFEKIYADSGNILAGPPPGFPREKLQKTSFDNPAIDFRFSRSMTRCFALVALHHFANKDHERAVKTLLLAVWFSHFIARGGGEVPCLLDLMISIALRKIVCGEILWSSLAAGDFPREKLEQFEKALAGLESSQPAYVDSLEWELVGSLNATRQGLLNSTSNEEMTSLAQHLPRENRAQVVEQAMNDLAAVREKVLNLASVYRFHPRKMREYTVAYVEALQSDVQMRMSDYLDPGRKIGRILAGIMIPNFSKAYDQYLAARYREKGTILLIRFLARRRPTVPLPKTGSEFETAAQGRIPRDLFAEQPKNPCRFSLDNDWMTIYSIGTDQVDNHGDGKDDFILFKVPVKFLKK